MPIVPPFITAAVILFWGWQTGFLPIAVPLAILVESPRLIRARYDFTTRDFQRIWDFSAAAFVLLAAYTFTANEGGSSIRDMVQGFLAARPAAAARTARAALALLQWLPMIFFPILAAQLYSSSTQVPLSTFSLWLRKQRARKKNPPPERGVNVVYPFIAVCLGASSISLHRDLSFYLGFSLLLAWVLWYRRSPRVGAFPWAAAIAIAVALGYGGQLQIERLHRYLENVNPDWFVNWRRHGLDLREGSTALGRIGRLHLSNRIVLRVKPKVGPAPDLLRQASYRKFAATIWRGIVSNDEYGTVLPEQDQTTWALAPDKQTPLAVNIGTFLEEGRGLLPLPNGTVRLEQLGVFSLKTNRLGVVFVDSGPGLVVFDAVYGKGGGIDGQPGEQDYDIPDKELPAIAAIAGQLNLSNAEPKMVTAALRDHFREHFEYTTRMLRGNQQQGVRTPVSRFLIETRAGHCEYFASAAVLLLRYYGVPARYAVGYIVQEQSRGTYLVRERHAHAWALVYYNGHWHDFDPTPGNGSEAAVMQASLLQSLADTWSHLWFQFNRWRWGQGSIRKYVLWVLVPVLVLLLAQLLLRREWRRAKNRKNAASNQQLWPGLDSEFFKVHERLVELGFSRGRNEPWRTWVTRLQLDDRAATQTNLIPLVLLHHRYRFDPAGISPPEREELRRHARTVLASLEAN